LSLGLSNDQEQALRRAALNGDYHLLLGAGASRESLSRNGSPLPTGPELAALLASEFGAPLEEGDLLWRVYARAVERAGEATVYAWFRSRFWEVSPPAWMDTYARTPWACVWTLNVDDSFERAYARVTSEASRRLSTVNWDDEFRLTRHLSVVHLHGCADRDAPRRLVFSLNEYASTAVARAAWPLNFRDIYGVTPFVIVGARLRDEPDIEAVVSGRKPVHDAPSFYVSPHISLAVESDLRAWGLVPANMTAERFAEIWPELTGMNLREAPTQQEEIAFRVGRQFSELRTDITSRRPPDHDFVGGDEPLWVDIQDNLYAELDWIRQARSDCQQLGSSVAATSAVIYVGRRLTGRSTGLLAIGRELRRLAWRTFLFVGDERLDVDAILRFAADGKAVALLFDSVADIADDVASVIHRARSSGLRIAFVAVDQIDRAASIVGRFEEAYLVHRRIATINPRLTATDARRLVDKLFSLGRLGILESERADRRRIVHFRNKELFDSMAQLENAPGFGRRVDGLVNALESELHLEILFLTALASRVERRLHIIDAARMTSIGSDQFVRLVRHENSMSALLVTDGQWVKPRHRWMALEACRNRLGEQPALNLLSEAIRRVTPRLGRASQRERNATSMLVGSLMSYNNLVEIFPSSDLDPWYESLSGSFGTWSARYWEQRAIMSRHVGRTRLEALSRAESFALRAVSIVRDAYSLTTLGTVLLAKAAYGHVDVDQYYDRAVSAFEAASDEDPANLVTWLAFLRHSLDVREQGQKGVRPISADFEERLNDDWQRIHVRIASIANISESTERDLNGLLRRYKVLAQGEESPMAPQEP